MARKARRRRKLRRAGVVARVRAVGNRQPGARRAGRGILTWLVRHRPEDESALTVCWGDARLSNAIFDDSGQLVGALLTGSRLVCAPRNGLRLVACHSSADAGGQRPRRRSGTARVRQPRRRDPTLRGDHRRALVDLDWYEIFAMVRIAYYLAHAGVLRSSGQADHFLTRAPILPTWTREAICN